MTSGKNIESFIRKHRDAFDDRKAPDHVWSQIDRRLLPKVSPVWKYVAVAASSLLLVAMGYIFGMKVNSQPDIAGWNEFLETEQYYQTRIQDKVKQIRTVGVDQQVITDLELLDEVYQDMRRQLLEDPNADAQLLLSAMVRHQQDKLDLMEQILERVDRYKSQEIQQHEM